MSVRREVVSISQLLKRGNSRYSDVEGKHVILDERELNAQVFLVRQKTIGSPHPAIQADLQGVWAVRRQTLEAWVAVVRPQHVSVPANKERTFLRETNVIVVKARSRVHNTKVSERASS